MPYPGARPRARARRRADPPTGARAAAQRLVTRCNALGLHFCQLRQRALGRSGRKRKRPFARAQAGPGLGAAYPHRPVWRARRETCSPLPARPACTPKRASRRRRTLAVPVQAQSKRGQSRAGPRAAPGVQLHFSGHRPQAKCFCKRAAGLRRASGAPRRGHGPGKAEGARPPLVAEIISSLMAVRRSLRLAAAPGRTSRPLLRARHLACPVRKRSSLTCPVRGLSKQAGAAEVG